MSKVAYIIPLHKKDERVFRAIESVPELGVDVYVSFADEKIYTWLESQCKREGVVFLNAGEDAPNKSYPELVNYGIKRIMDGEAPDYISILEFDDALTPNSIKILDEYMSEYSDADIIAPLACVVKENDDPKDDAPILLGMSNEVVFAPNIAEEYGLVDFNMMLRSNYMFVNGCYIKPSVFEEWGTFKTNFKMFYDYEWALRMVYNGAVIRGVPKATHFHYVSDDGAFETQKKQDRSEIEKWLGAARREYFFDEDREIFD